MRNDREITDEGAVHGSIFDSNRHARRAGPAKLV
jgi:hypothetical protein